MVFILFHIHNSLFQDYSYLASDIARARARAHLTAEMSAAKSRARDKTRALRCAARAWSSGRAGRALRIS